MSGGTPGVPATGPADHQASPQRVRRTTRRPRNGPDQKEKYVTLLEETSAVLQEAASDLGPAVVGLGRGWGVGSGVVIAPGRVLTNAHNLRHQEATVTFGDGRRESAHVLGSDADLDVAVLEVDTGDVEPV